MSVVMPEDKGSIDALGILRENVVYERYKFNQRSRADTERIDDYVGELTKMAELCLFGVLKSGLIRDRLICDVKDHTTRANLLSFPYLTLDQAVKICHEGDSQKLQTEEENRESEVDANTRDLAAPCIDNHHHYNKLLLNEKSILEISRSIGSRKYVIIPKDSVLHVPATMAKISIPGQSAGNSSELIETTKDSSPASSAELPESQPIETDDPPVPEMEDDMLPNSPVEDDGPTVQADFDEVNLRYKCVTCDKNFKAKVILESHLRMLHPGMTVVLMPEKAPWKYGCDVCGKRFDAERYIKDHMLTHKGEKSHKCEECGKCFAQKSQMKNHVKAVHLKTTVRRPKAACPVCGKLLARRDKLEDHIRTHIKDFPYPCDQCERGYSTEAQLREHMGRHSNPDRYTCSTCGKILLSKYHLVLHEKLHTTDPSIRPFSCTNCGKSFRSLKLLRMHEILHSEAKFCCEICGVQNPSRGLHNTHMKQQHCEEKVLCQQCGKEFKSFSHLRSHEKNIHNPKRFICAVCNKGFVVRPDLERHIRTHTKSIKNVCNKCGRVFKKEHNLKAHIQNVHKCEMEEGIFQ